MDMSDAIERFQQSLPPELQGRLDYSPESLEVVEGFALAKYAHGRHCMGRSLNSMRDTVPA